MNKILVSYFSCSGKTKKAAENLNLIVNGDLYEIKPEEPYTSENLNWHNPSSRSSIEMENEDSRPAIIKDINNISEYDIIFLGFPIWWYKAPTIINTFLESYNLSGKTIIPFCTSGGSTIKGAENNLVSKYHNINWLPGKEIQTYTNKQELLEFINNLNIL